MPKWRCYGTIYVWADVEAADEVDALEKFDSIHHNPDAWTQVADDHFEVDFSYDDLEEMGGLFEPP